jgi:hypothetical protein
MSEFFETGIKDIVFAFGELENKYDIARTREELITQQLDNWVNYAEYLEKLLIRYKSLADSWNELYMSKPEMYNDGHAQMITMDYEVLFVEYMKWQSSNEHI